MASGEQLELEGVEKASPEATKHKQLKTSEERRKVIREHAKGFGLPVENFVNIHRNSYIDSKMNAEMEKMHAENQSRNQPKSSRGGVGGGGMNPADIEKVPGKKPLKMKKGGAVSSASKRADGIAIRGKTRA
jgi:hypothetical protein